MCFAMPCPKIWQMGAPLTSPSPLSSRSLSSKDPTKCEVLSLGLPGQTRLNFTSWVAKYSSSDQPGPRQPRRRRVRFKRVPFRGSLAWTLS